MTQVSERTADPAPDQESQTPAGGTLRKFAKGYVLCGAVIVPAVVVLMFSGLGDLAVGIGAFVLLLCLMLFRIPVGIALALSGLLGILALSGSAKGVLNTLRQSPWSSADSWVMSVIPMFVLMGMLLERSGLGADIFRSVRAMIGRAPAGMAVSTNFAGAAMGAASGSTLGIVYSLGRTGIPEMVRAGYDRRLAAGSILMAGTGGQLIPPSILLVIYAGIAQVPVGQQLMSGMLPGILLHVVYAIMMVALVLAKPKLAPRDSPLDMTISERIRRSLGIWPVILLVLVVMGGLYAGFFTPTEAGAFGVVTAALVVVVTKGAKVLVREFGMALRNTVIATGGIFLIVIGGEIFGRFMTVTGIPTDFSMWLDSVDAGPHLFMIMVLVMYILLGTFMDPVPMMLITVPILLPVAVATGVDPLVFGVFAVLLGELAVITPPVGILLYVVHGLAKDAEVPMSLSEVIQGAMWFYPITIAFAVLMIFFPELVTWLPSLMGG